MPMSDNRDLTGHCNSCGAHASQEHVFDCEWYNRMIEDLSGAGEPEGGTTPDWSLYQGALMVLPDTPLNDIAGEIHLTAVEKGWWDEERSVAEMLANVHAEVSEAWEDWRIGREEMTFSIRADEYPRDFDEEVGSAFRTFINWASAAQNGDEVGELPSGTMATLVNAGVAEPIGMEVEIADIIIRCLDILAARGCDVDKVVRTKMNYNKTRARRHGGKRA